MRARSLFIASSNKENNNIMKRCINIDWLQLYCIEQFGYALSSALVSHNFTVMNKGLKTRHFQEMLEVYRDGYKIFEIQHLPYSIKNSKTGNGVWYPGACLIKLDNRQCYETDCVSKLCDILLSLNITIKSISRLDICSDFQYFDNGLKPENLIKNFLKEIYWKCGTANFTVIGNQKQKNSYEYIRFGSGNSPINCYLYNKTKELADVKEKPYIRDAWASAGYDETKDVWRLEFSLKSDAKHMIICDSVILKNGKDYYNKTTGEILECSAIVKEDARGTLREIIPINISTIDRRDEVMRLWNKLAAHYFVFKHNDGKTIKRNAKKVELFNIQTCDTNCALIRLTDAIESGRMEKIVQNYLHKMSDENDELLQPVFMINKELVKKYRI